MSDEDVKVNITSEHTTTVRPRGDWDALKGDASILRGLLLRALADAPHWKGDARFYLAEYLADDKVI